MRFRSLVSLAVVSAGSLAACATATAPAAPQAAPNPSGSAWVLYRGSASSPPPDPNQLAPGEADGPGMVAAGTFMPWRPGTPAVTYDPAVVPPGARARLAITSTTYGVVVRLTVGGLVPRRAYGAHLHTQPCTGAPDGAGPHYQHVHDPHTPSVDPSYANPENEVWLDFTADGGGAATAVSAENWTFDPAAPPRSLVIHAQQTRTADSMAGMAGARAACLTLPLG